MRIVVYYDALSLFTTNYIPPEIYEIRYKDLGLVNFYLHFDNQKLQETFGYSLDFHKKFLNIFFEEFGFQSSNLFEIITKYVGKKFAGKAGDRMGPYFLHKFELTKDLNIEKLQEELSNDTKKIKKRKVKKKKIKEI